MAHTILLLFSQLSLVSSAVRWSGSLGPTSVRIAAEPASSTGLLLVSQHASLSPPLASFQVTSDKFVVEVSNLTSDSLYFYGFDASDVASFRTSSLEHKPLRIAFASCAWTGSRSKIFSRIAQLNPPPLVFIQAGDLHYQNIAEDSLARFEDAYHKVHSSPTQRELFSKMPIIYIWDDHDFGGNNAIGTSKSKPAALAAYRKFVPAKLAEEADGGAAGIFQAYSLNGVRVLVMDLRSQSTPAHGSTLGLQQRQWLLQQLASWRDYRLLLLVSSKPWLGVQGQDDWSGYAEERQLISDAIAELGVRNLVMVAGDAHMLAADDGSNTDFSTLSGAARGNASLRAGFPIFQAAPLSQLGSSKSGPYSHGCFAYRYFVNHQFGVMDVDGGDASSLCVRLRGYRDDKEAAEIEMKVCADSEHGLMKKGTRTSLSASQCSIPLAPPELVGTLLAGIILEGLLLLLQLFLCFTGRMNCCWECFASLQSLLLLFRRAPTSHPEVNFNELEDVQVEEKATQRRQQAKMCALVFLVQLAAVILIVVPVM
ncbi:hypothetical protein GUITHDRAFT_140586 [Guillardia theta CCMP2712]|uniref:PhoD-like phosphatase metallophosphatase domain-containing protein n=1 Tax=Guillardia theta (strain CCMP2712) TaxID=905079 RepID=L1J437_GUITC|nr:hypothetical protein GUITHDRAFT_140586 [Guillardia theta CCMP2712]EKX43266.1 hypothetical protein GUITHDRAFT_140586 [Guillardia theta CCMP2712]|eukprot:XP_005830246.1 hypothetical protein GUITHDRAFT_140586 [Guillardia theta CCMP2712]